MSKRHNAKLKCNRRLGVNLWGREKSPFNTRPQRPGQHGKGMHKNTEYGTQLLAKQKLKMYYGDITEKMFKKYFEKATKQKGDASQNAIGLLERRLDSVVYRLKFVPTIFAARQFVNHGHVRVNGKKVNIASYLVEEGDVIAVGESSKNIPMVLEASSSAERQVPDYMKVDYKKLEGQFIRVPKLEEIPYPVKMEPQVIVAYYSR